MNNKFYHDGVAWDHFSFVFPERNNNCSTVFPDDSADVMGWTAGGVGGGVDIDVAGEGGGGGGGGRGSGVCPVSRLLFNAIHLGVKLCHLPAWACKFKLDSRAEIQHHQ